MNQDNIYFILHPEDKTPDILKIIDESGWHFSDWVRETFRLYYILIDLNSDELILNNNHTQKITKFLLNRRKLYELTKDALGRMKGHRISADLRYCEIHEVSVAQKTPYEIKWEDSVQVYEEGIKNIKEMTPTTYEPNKLTLTDLNLTSVIVDSATIGYGNQLYQVINRIDVRRNGPMVHAFYQKMRSL
jgi:hypothetical protein